MININTIKEPVCRLYDDSGICLGNITSDIQFLDVRCQIMDEGIGGYYVIWNNYIIKINKDGCCDEWPKGFYDQNEAYLDRLCRWGS